jgi:hypothetical protein
VTEELAGGNSGPVIRDGDAIRKPSGPWTPQVHAYMRALRERGLAFVPEPRGIDEQGREVVEFVEGDVGIYPMPDWVWSDELLVEVTQVTRRLHDASIGLDLPLDGWRREAVQPVEVMCHVDLAPYNTVCRDGHLVALIDWDYATPAPRGWDLGYLAYRWVALTPHGYDDREEPDLPEQRRRLRLLCDTYGGVEPDEVLGWAIRRLEDLVAYSLAQVAADNPTFIATNEAGHTAYYQRTIAWLKQEWRP